MIHKSPISQVKWFGRFVQWMKFIVKTTNLIHTAADARFLGRCLRPKNHPNYLLKESSIVHPFPRPELCVTPDHFGLQVLHAAEIDEANGSVVIKKIVSRMWIGMQSLDAKELKEEQAGQAGSNLISKFLAWPSPVDGAAADWAVWSRERADVIAGL